MRAPAVVWLVLGACGNPSPPGPDAPLPTSLPERLSQTGLYDDVAAKQLAAGTQEFAPANVLWSDGAVKQRWIQLPAGAVIDTGDMDHWKFPVGTRFFKEFAREGKRLETRAILRVSDTGDREADTLFGSYVWDDTETEAYFVEHGQEDVRGTDHDAPAADVCWRCHIGEAGHVLGYSALQLGDVSELPLSDPPPAGTTFAAPNAAVGYLHANCGHCHNPGGGAWSDSHMVLRLDVDEHDAATTTLAQSTVGAELEQWVGRGFTYRIVAGDPDASALMFRPSSRTKNVQMPPLATEHIDDAGLALLRSWIQSL